MESRMIEMEERLITHLDECLAAIAAGESVESSLARYPHEADQLAPFLQIALALTNLPQPEPSAATARTAKNRLLAEASRRPAPIKHELSRSKLSQVWVQILQRFSGLTWPAPVRAFATTTLTLVLILLIGGGVIHAASGSLPGDPLYGFKLLGEDVQRALTFSDDSRIRLEQGFTARRLDEVRQLLDLGRQEEVVFGGLFRQQIEDQWRIEDILVTVDAETRVQADPMLHLFVEIHGITQADGTVLAQLVEIEGDEIVGRVETIGQNQWQVAGQHIRVDDKTYIQDQPQVGDCVEVRARRFSDGTLLALEIERTERCSQDMPIGGEEDTSTETPTATPVATPTPTPTSTPTPSPTATLTPSATSAPETAATASPTAEPGDDEEDDVTPRIQPSPSPTTPPPGSPPTGTDAPEDDEDSNSNEDDTDSIGEDNSDGNDSDDGAENDSGSDDDSEDNDDGDDDNGSKSNADDANTNGDDDDSNDNSDSDDGNMNDDSNDNDIDEDNENDVEGESSANGV